MITLLFLLTIPSIPEDYKLEIGDEIAITVSGKINFTYSQKISPEGNVFIQSGGLALWSPGEGEIVPAGATVLGIVKILNRTLEEAKEIAKETFKKYFKDIDVSITLVRFEDVVYVEGAVVSPRAYPFFPGKTARDYIGLAGGPLSSGNLKDIKITTPENKIINGSLDTIPLRNSVINVPQSKIYAWKDYIAILGGISSIVYWITLTKDTWGK
ncbi:MAG: hypothetical protein COT09_03215 [Candidatus Hydromicrobium americanum]|nr:MAG: hypothetical protein COT09_03215 [Candidatus Hydromicrobium americanum]